MTYSTPAGVAAVQLRRRRYPGHAAVAVRHGELRAGAAGQLRGRDQLRRSGTTSGVLPDAAGRVLLGYAHVPRLGRGVRATLGAVDPNTAGGDTTSFNPVNSYDSFLVAGAATLTVTPVPEPGSLALVGMAAAGLVACAAGRPSRADPQHTASTPASRGASAPGTRKYPGARPPARRGVPYPATTGLRSTPTPSTSTSTSSPAFRTPAACGPPPRPAACR